MDSALSWLVVLIFGYIGMGYGLVKVIRRDGSRKQRGKVTRVYTYL